MNTDFKFVEKKITVAGWELVRTSGLHFQYKKEGIPCTITIPKHNWELSIGVLKNLERTTGLSLRR